MLKIFEWHDFYLLLGNFAVVDLAVPNTTTNSLSNGLLVAQYFVTYLSMVK